MDHTVDGSEIRQSPVEVGSLSHSLQGFKHPTSRGVGFLPSTVSYLSPPSPTTKVGTITSKWTQTLRGEFPLRKNVSTFGITDFRTQKTGWLEDEDWFPFGEGFPERVRTVSFKEGWEFQKV